MLSVRLFYPVSVKDTLSGAISLAIKGYTLDLSFSKGLQALLAKERDRGSDAGFIVLLAHSSLILYLRMGLLASHAAHPPIRPPLLHFSVAAIGC